MIIILFTLNPLYLTQSNSVASEESINRGLRLGLALSASTKSSEIIGSKIRAIFSNKRSPIFKNK